MLRALRLHFRAARCRGDRGYPWGAGGADRYTGVAARDSGRRRGQWLVARGDGPVGPSGRGFLSLRHRWLAGPRPIPADEAAYGISEELHDLTIEQLLGLLERLAASDALPEGSDEWKAVQLFAQGIDYDTRNAQGIEPIAGDLARIEAISTLDELYAFLRDGVLTTNASGLYGVSPGVDLQTARSTPSGTAVPRSACRTATTTGRTTRPTSRSARRTAPSAPSCSASPATTRPRRRHAAQRVYDFEKRLAEPLLRPADANDPANYYHPRPVADLIAANPDFDWPAFLEILGIAEQETVVVTEEAYLDAIDDIVNATDLETLKDYLTAPGALEHRLRADQGDGRHGILLLRHDPLRRRGAEPRRRAGAGRGQWRARRSPRQALRRGVLPAGGEGADRGAGRAHQGRHARPHREPRLDVAGDEGEGAGQARHHARQGRLSRQVAHLRERHHRGFLRRVRAQREHRRVQARARPHRRTGRSRRVGHAAANGQRLLLADEQRDRLPGGDPATAILRLSGRSGLQLRRHRRHDRTRDHARLRPERLPVRRRWQPGQLVDAGGHRAVHGAHGSRSSRSTTRSRFSRASSSMAS